MMGLPEAKVLSHPAAYSDPEPAAQIRHTTMPAVPEASLESFPSIF